MIKSAFIALAFALLGAQTASATTIAHAIDPFTAYLADTYIGPARTGQPNADAYGGDRYDVHGLTVSREADNSLSIAIETNFAGYANRGIGYGDILFGDAGTFETGWSYALDMARNPGVDSGDLTLYRISDANLGYGSYREGVFVEIADYSNAEVVGTGNWRSVLGDTLHFSFSDGGVLGESFATQWAMTCGNDVIAGDIHVALRGPTPDPPFPGGPGGPGEPVNPNEIASPGGLALIGGVFAIALMRRRRDMPEKGIKTQRTT